MFKKLVLVVIIDFVGWNLIIVSDLFSVVIIKLLFDLIFLGLLN